MKVLQPAQVSTNVSQFEAISKVQMHPSIFEVRGFALKGSAGSEDFARSALSCEMSFFFANVSSYCSSVNTHDVKIFLETVEHEDNSSGKAHEALTIMSQNMRLLS